MRFTCVILSRGNDAEQHCALGGEARIRASVAVAQRCGIPDRAGRAAEVSAVVVEGPGCVGAFRILKQHLRAIGGGGTAVDVVLIGA